MSETIRQPKSLSHLEQLKRVVRGEVTPSISELIGFRLVYAEVGEATMELDTTKRHANPMGTLHGGIIADVADAAIGMAMKSTLEEDESFTSLDLTTKFFKPIWKARLSFKARVTKRTRSLGFIECDVTDEGGSLVAKVISSCMVLRGEEAKGR